MRADVECLKKHLEMREKEHALLNRQIRGLQEDNERIAKMYTLVQNVREGKPIQEEVAAPCNVWEHHKLADKVEQQVKKGWRVASEDFSGSPGGGSFSNTLHFRRDGAALQADADRVITIKRN